MEEKVILHRGYWGEYPENSSISFEKALDECFNLETDIRVSRDGVCFMIHDDTLDRLFNSFGKVEEKDSEELKDVKYKEDETQNLCSLEELCELIKNAENKESLIFIHIKELEDIKNVIKTLGKYDFSDRIRFFACDEITLDFIRIIKEKHPQYKVGLHFYENNNFTKEDFEKADFIWADEITKENITKELVESTHSLDKPIYVISPELIPESIFNKNIKKRWKEFLDMGIDGVCIDLNKEFLDFILS